MYRRIIRSHYRKTIFDMDKNKSAGYICDTFFVPSSAVVSQTVLRPYYRKVTVQIYN